MKQHDREGNGDRKRAGKVAEQASTSVHRGPGEMEIGSGAITRANCSRRLVRRAARPVCP